MFSKSIVIQFGKFFEYSLVFKNLSIIPSPVIFIISPIYSILYSYSATLQKKASFIFYIFISILSTVLVFCADNLFTMFVNYELLTLSTIPLVFFHRSEKSQRSTQAYLKILIFASFLLFFPAVLIVEKYIPYHQFTNTHEISSIIGHKYAVILYLMFFFGIAKTAMFPFHRWLLCAMCADYPVSAILHSVAVVKSGIFCLTKISLYIFGTKFLSEIKFLVIVPLVSFAYSAIRALIANDLKQVLAYSTINQLALCVILFITVEDSGYSSGQLAYIHSYVKISLFIICSYFYLKVRTNYLADYYGLQSYRDFSVIIFFLLILLLAGVPFTPVYYVKQGALSLMGHDLAYYAIKSSTYITLSYFGRVFYLITLKKPHLRAQTSNNSMLILVCVVVVIFLVNYNFDTFFPIIRY